MVRDNLTAKAARWSAGHRLWAVFGWLGFVVVAFAIGQAAGLVLMKDEDFAIGDSHAAEVLLAREFATERARELVLIQSREGQLEPGRAGSGRQRPRRASLPRAIGVIDRVAPGSGQ